MSRMDSRLPDLGSEIRAGLTMDVINIKTAISTILCILINTQGAKTA